MSLVSAPCFICALPTKFVHLDYERFFCRDQLCLDLYKDRPQQQQPPSPDVIRSTKQIRKKPKIICPVEGDQRCHKAGLSLLKAIFNHYAREGQRLSRRALKQLIADANAPDNIYCCSDEQNIRDKYTERQLLDCILYKKTRFSSLSKEARDMFTSLLLLLQTLDLHFQGKNPVIRAIRRDLVRIK